LALRINKSDVSNKSWGDVDKSKIWARLKEALQNDEAGAKAAVKEMYAVVMAEINEDLTQADCWGPHHEIRGDEIVLNRNGVIAAVQALSGARAEPNLSDAQFEEARRHLLRHYKELELEPPEVLTGEMFIDAELVGEMSVENIPVASWVKLDELKKDDPNPLEVVVAIPAGVSKRGYRYTEKALQKIVDTVNKQGLPGGLGHQKPENINHEFLHPATHWVGAKMENGVAYFRGVVDKSAEDLKRWIRANTIRTVSIYGLANRKVVNGEVVVDDFQPLSIDWTPLGRNGMDTRIVAIGEIDSIGEEEKELDKNELIEKIKEAGITIGEMIDVLGGDEYKNKMKIIGEIETLWGDTGESLLNKLKQAKEVIDKAEQEERNKVIDEVLSEMVVFEALRPLVKKMINTSSKDKEEIKKIVGEIMESNEMKIIIDGFLKDKGVRSIKTETPNINIVKQRI
jgi:hypothetical protein